MEGSNYSNSISVEQTAPWTVTNSSHQCATENPTNLGDGTSDSSDVTPETSLPLYDCGIDPEDPQNIGIFGNRKMEKTFGIRKIHYQVIKKFVAGAGQTINKTIMNVEIVSPNYVNRLIAVSGPNAELVYEWFM